MVVSNISSPTISIIVPVYNVAPYLAGCLDSILAQTYPNLQVIVVDDGSTDGSSSICDAYARNDTRICVIHQSNQGVAIARNNGLDAVTGQYIGFVDPDDVIMQDMYEKLFRAIKESGSQMAQCGVCVDFAHNDTKNNKYSCSTYSGIDFLQLGMEGKVHITLWCNLYNAELWENIRFLPGYCYEDEMVFPLLTALSARVTRIEKKLYVYRRLETGIVRSAKTMMHLRSKEKMLETLEKLYVDLDVNKALASFYLCKILPSYRLAVRPNVHIAADTVRVHNAKMHAIFLRHLPLARKHAAYAKMPLVKRVYWRCYSYAPRLAIFFVGMVKKLVGS